MSKILAIFDVDGTLVYSEQRDSQCFADTYLELYGRPFPTLDWLQFPHVTDTSIFGTAYRAQFGVLPEVAERERFIQAYVKKLLEKRQEDPGHSKSIPNAPAMLELLAGHEGYDIAIATGGWELPARTKLAHISVDHQNILMSCADRHETRADIINAVLEQKVRKEGRQFEKIVYIGDALWDVYTTRALQMDFVGIRWRGDVDILQKAGADQVITGYEEVDYFLECLERARPPR